MGTNGCSYSVQLHGPHPRNGTYSGILPKHVRNALQDKWKEIVASHSSSFGPNTTKYRIGYATLWRARTGKRVLDSTMQNIADALGISLNFRYADNRRLPLHVDDSNADNGKADIRDIALASTSHVERVPTFSDLAQKELAVVEGKIERTQELLDQYTEQKAALELIVATYGKALNA